MASGTLPKNKCPDSSSDSSGLMSAAQFQKLNACKVFSFHCTTGSQSVTGSASGTITKTETIPAGCSVAMVGGMLFNASHYNFYPQGIPNVSLDEAGTTATFTITVKNRLTSDQTAYYCWYYVILSDSNLEE